MASFGKLTNAFLQASQETTLAFANLNFDFSLIKYEAPKEYQGLGDALSPRRRAAAEDGSGHVTARKLGGLFQGAIPPVPNLIRAYGLRASEAANKPDVNPTNKPRLAIFGDHVGPDGTSIWAAATSGPHAIPMHLLGCMLARIWKREEAVSIWSELVDQRRLFLQKLVAGSTSGFKVSDLAASRTELTRQQLDEWDSSTRAWLQSADEANRLRQTQLRLVLDNISLPVSTHGTVYEAIMEAWTQALNALESLVQGIPQRINNGAVLLGLSAWHLFPDILVAGTNKLIKQEDQLIERGGVITVGLKNRDEEEGKGVYWSLPLSQARYYGDPVIATRHVGIGESQVRFEEIQFVVLGALLGCWSGSDMSQDGFLRLVSTLARIGSNEPTAPSTNLLELVTLETLDFLKILGSASDVFQSSRGMHRQQMSRLVSFGQRRCKGFLDNPSPAPPGFGLTDLGFLVDVFGEHFEGKRSGEGVEVMDGTGRDFRGSVRLLKCWARIELAPSVAQNCIIRYFVDSDNRLSSRITAVMTPARPRKRRKGFETDPGSQFHWEGDAIWDEATAYIEEKPRLAEEPVGHTFLCGNPKTAAVFVLASTGVPPIRGNCMSISTLNSYLESDQADDNAIREALYAATTARATIPTNIRHESQASKHSGSSRALVESLRAVRKASHIYEQFPEARVNLEVTARPIRNSKWWIQLSKSRRLSLSTILSCISYFETGGFDIEPDIIGDHVFAMCHANSIFVASKLLSDPLEKLADIPVQRIVGNVGRPGLAFMVSPPNPRMRKVDFSSWHMVSHDAFDGKSQDRFSETSFHLSFTGYELPMNVGLRSTRDVPAYILETVVSVFDKDEWVADVDIMQAAKVWVEVPKKSCVCDEKVDQELVGTTLVTIDTWLELIDHPTQNAVIRAHGNPIARLATAALATRLGEKVLVLPDKVCWRCQVYTINEYLARDTQERPPQTPTRCATAEEFDNDDKENRGEVDEDQDSEAGGEENEISGHEKGGEEDLVTYLFDLSPLPADGDEEDEQDSHAEDQAPPAGFVLFVQ